MNKEDCIRLVNFLQGQIFQSVLLQKNRIVPVYISLLKSNINFKVKSCQNYVRDLFDRHLSENNLQRLSALIVQAMPVM